MDELDELERIKQKILRDMTGSRSDLGSGKEWPVVPVKVVDSTLTQLVGKYPFVVVDCWAEWCAPCRMISPILEAMSRDYRGRIVFGKLNIDDNPATAREYTVMSIPTLLVFKNGALVDRIVGAAPRQMIEAKLKPYL